MGQRKLSQVVNEAVRVLFELIIDSMDVETWAAVEAYSDEITPEEIFEL